jgi:hypothetical protein
MPIIDKTKAATDPHGVPSDIVEALQNAIELQRLKDIYAQEYDDARTAAIAKIAESKEVILTIGDTLETPVCDVISYYKTNHKYDVDLMVKLVEEGHVSLKGFLSCVKGFDPTLVSAVFAGHGVLESTPAKNPVFALKPTADMVAALDERVGEVKTFPNLLHLNEKAAA